MKIWIVTSRFGYGHLSVANALEEELTDQGHQVVTSDIIELLHPKLAKMIYGVFGRVVCKNTVLYNMVSSLGKKQLTSPFESSLEEMTQAIDPDIIISTWSGCARKFKNVQVPVYNCITDIGAHEGWVDSHVSGYLVASHITKKQLVDLGVDRNLIHLYGIPVRKCFHYSKREGQKEKNVLIMGGGLGIIDWLDQVLEKIHDCPEVKVTVITGHNRKLYNRLVKTYPHVEVVGFTDEIYKYMSRASMIVSKPGGVSLFESIFTETPFIAIEPSFSQESTNASYIAEMSIGSVLSDDDSIFDRVMSLIHDEHTLNRYQKNMKSIKEDLLYSKQKVGLNIA